MILRNRILLVIGCVTVSLSAMGQSHETRVTMKVTPTQVEAHPSGPYEATWESVSENYRTPEWFKDAKFGIFIHWGPYVVPATGSEWYPKHMYNGLKDFHRQRWGAQNVFGYKDFIPLFRAEHFDAKAWAELFKKAGARYVIPTAEHHDGFAMYDSKLTKWNARRMGPKRDVIGELAQAVRGEGMKFGVSNHRVENWDFMYPSMPKDSTDLFNPKFAGLYGPPQKPGKNSGMGPATPNDGPHPQSDAFMNEWQMRVEEIIDKYQPDLLYFDNGINYRSMDPWKLRIARYYYNSASHWGKDVSIQSKSNAYLAGSIQDFERESRAPKELSQNYWQVDDPIGNKFGYVVGLKLQNADGIIRNLVENICRDGNLCLNVSPMADGTIPADQQEVLLRVGKWLERYGDGVYGTRAYSVFGEGPNVEGHPSENNIRFTCKGDTLYAFVVNWDGKPFTIHTLSGLDVRSVTSMADNSKVEFIPTAGGVFINVERQVTDKVVGFKIVVKKGRSVLYIGDSITDGAWGRSNGGAQPSDKRSLGDQNHIYGHSYVMLCAAHYQSAYPMTDYKFYNRGISGDGIDELVKRWQQDALDLHPDVVSILIGTNDINAYIGRKQNNTAETFDMTTWEKKYRQLLDQLRSANPLVKIFLGTPFVAKEGNVGKQSDFFLRKQLIHEMGEVVRHIANDYGAVVLPYDEMFESLIIDQPRPGYWIWDGIHPTPAGHQKMSELWIRQARNAGIMP